MVRDARDCSFFCSLSSLLVMELRRTCMRCPPRGEVVPRKRVYESVGPPIIYEYAYIFVNNAGEARV